MCFGGNLYFCLVFFKLYFKVRRADPLGDTPPSKCGLEGVWRSGDQTVCSQGLVIGSL